jgi:molybdopterin-guanine dinucleotide biosynthesis protein A
VTDKTNKSTAAELARYVLAGGESRRFGKDKAMAEIGGKPMLMRMCELVAAGATVAADEVKIVGATDKYGGFGAPCIVDRWPGEGPLGGIITALANTAAQSTACEWNLILSCDMPFLSSDWLIFLIGRAFESKAQVVVAKSSFGLEPLCACWRTSARPVIEEQFNLGVRKVTSVFEHLRTEVLDEKDWKRFDSAGRLFWNMNTPADYEEARRIWKRKKHDRYFENQSRRTSESET